MDGGRLSDGTQIHDLIARFRSWLDQSDAESGSVITEILSLDFHNVRALIAAAPETFGRRAVGVLIDRARRTIGDTPRVAAGYCQVAIKIAENLWSDSPEEDVGLIGDAWRELASSLLTAGDSIEADDACRNAYLYYNIVSPLRAVECSVLALIHGQVMHELGQSDQGLNLIERHANLFLSLYSDKKKYVEARTIYAVVLLKRQEYSRALESLESSAAIAEEEKDTEVLAYILNNIGLCWVNLGNLTKAKECLTAAAEMFAARKLRAESARVRGSLALLLIQHGKYNEAISEYYMCRSTFLELDMPIVAAQAGLRVVEVLFLAGRTGQVPSLCGELVTTFTNAGLPREAQKALAYLNELARLSKADEFTVRHVREFMERLEINSAAQFEPSADEG